MPLIPKGLFFLDLKAIKEGQLKAKYFIALTEGDLEDERIICFVLNTENRPNLYTIECNKEKGKFILVPTIHKFTFIKHATSIMTHEPRTYTVKYLCESNDIRIQNDIAGEMLLRKIKNCLDEKHLLPWELKKIKENYKIQKRK